MDNIKLKQLGAILLLAGLVLVGLTLNAQRKEGFFESPPVVQGRVIDRFTSATRGSAEPELVLRVEIPGDGPPRRFDRTVDEAYWNAHDKGTSVQVALSGANLNEAKLVGATDEMFWVWLKLIGGGVATVLGLVVIGYDRWRT